MHGPLRDLFSRVIAWGFTQEDSIEKVARTLIGAALDNNIGRQALRDAIAWHDYTDD